MRRWLLVPLVLTTACTLGTDPNDGGQIGEESGSRCEAVGHTPLAVDEESALGFAPQALVDLAVGSTTSTLTWADGASTTLHEDVVVTGAMELVDYEVVETATGNGGSTPMEMASWCPDQVEIEVTLGLTTDDGRFAESVATRLTASEATLVNASLSLDQPQGTFDAWDFAPANNDYDDLRAWIDLSWTDAGPAGVVQGQGEGTDGEVAFAENVEIGRWGAESE
ncbi:MAG: hypothetical protein KC621_11565 [Myxococcales bacterium]|nr:hypothetical protein [Myxococcales bacterium]